MKDIYFFKDIRVGDSAIAGGKGASLGEMMNNHFPVPNGYVVPASAFKEVVLSGAIGADIESQMKKADTDNMETLENASMVIQDIVRDVQLPDSLVRSIQQAFETLECTYVAVRSSATAEDSKIASWAGELETYLNTNESQLIERIKDCWASLYSPRALFYRIENGLHNEEVSVAVVIQEMVDSDVAGVCFTVHPVTEDPNQLIIEAAFGLGEAVVSGQVTPDSYIVEKSTGRIIETNIGQQKHKIVRDTQESNRTVLLNETEGMKQKLTTSQITQVASLAIHIESHYQFPVDIEWAIQGSRLFVTQARPITTLQ